MRPVFPSDLNTTVLSVRVPKSVAEAFDTRCEEIQANRSAALGGVVRLATKLSDAELRAAARLAQAKPHVSQDGADRVHAIDLEGRPGKFEPSTASRLNDAAYRRSEIAYRARHRAARANNRMPMVSDPVDVSYLSPEERTQYQAALAGRVAAPVTGAQAVPAPAKRPAPSKAAAPAKRAPTAAPTAPTRESLCALLGLDAAKAYGGEIRSKAKAIASGLPGMKSHPENAAALRAHLGLPRTASDDQVMSIVWSLTTPPGAAENPYQKRLARK